MLKNCKKFSCVFNSYRKMKYNIKCFSLYMKILQLFASFHNASFFFGFVMQFFESTYIFFLYRKYSINARTLLMQDFVCIQPFLKAYDNNVV